LDQVQGWNSNPESKAAEEETTDAPWKKKGNKGSRWRAAILPEEEEGNCNRHRRVELSAASNSGKRSTHLQDPQEDPRTGIREASQRDVQRVVKNDGPGIVEGWTPSETEKDTARRAGACNVEAQAPRSNEREREREREMENFGWTWIDRNTEGLLVETSPFKEEAWGAFGLWSPQLRKRKQ
jgi:hypothetical protein